MPAPLSRTGKKGVRNEEGGGGGGRGDGGGEQTEGVKVIWNLECPVGLSQKRIYVCISNERNWTQFGRSTEREKRRYVMFWNLVGRKKLRKDLAGVELSP